MQLLLRYFLDTLTSSHILSSVHTNNTRDRNVKIGWLLLFTLVTLYFTGFLENDIKLDTYGSTYFVSSPRLWSFKSLLVVAAQSIYKIPPRYKLYQAITGTVTLCYPPPRDKIEFLYFFYSNFGWTLALRLIGAANDQHCTNMAFLNRNHRFTSLMIYDWGFQKKIVRRTHSFFMILGLLVLLEKVCNLWQK